MPVMNTATRTIHGSKRQQKGNCLMRLSTGQEKMSWKAAHKEVNSSTNRIRTKNKAKFCTRCVKRPIPQS